MVRIRAQEVLGPPSMSDVSHSITILNRLMAWTDRGIELEADQRHVDLLLSEVGCEGAKITTPQSEWKKRSTRKIWMKSYVVCIVQQVCD